MIAGVPLWLLIALADQARLTGTGALLAGACRKDGAVFRILKFRSMRQDAEKEGAQWADEARSPGYEDRGDAPQAPP